MDAVEFLRARRKLCDDNVCGDDMTVKITDNAQVLDDTVFV